jgi:hypothetical protein
MSGRRRDNSHGRDDRSQAQTSNVRAQKRHDRYDARGGALLP